MHAAAYLVSVLLLSAPGELEYSLSIRDFDSAMELADTDSLRAVVFASAGNDTAAAELFYRAFLESPSAGLLAGYLETIVASDTSFSSRDMRDILRDRAGEQDWEPPQLLSLIETSSVLEDSSLADSLTDELLQRFPGSEEAYQVLGWEFYDRLYPVWYDDSARIPVIRAFVAERGASSSTWRSAAYRSLLSSVLNTPDSSSWHGILEEWLESCPEDPQACISGAALLIERDTSWTEALELARRGSTILEGGWRPVGMPEEEWALSGPAMEAGLQLRRLQALAGTGMTEEALASLDSVIGSFDPDIDDYNTGSSLHWLRGDMLLELGDTTEALSAFARSVSIGDVVDRWSGRSLQVMQDILLPGSSPLHWARVSEAYGGPVFVELTPLLGPDSLRGGSRVSWCDWNSDGWPDLFAGRRLYQNIEGTGFRDVTSEAGLDSCRGNGGIWGDLNRDGAPDLVTAGRPPQLFMSSNGVLREGILPGLDSTGAAVEGVGMLDWNGDGWLDVYLASYETPGELGSGTEDYFYLGGEEGLIRADDSLGMVPFLDRDLCGRGVSPCDYDRDGDMDIFVSNYRLQENFLWENRRGEAVNAALLRGVAGTETDGWWGHTIGSAWADWDNDGDWDLFSANLAHPRYITFSDRSMLYRNDGGHFTDVRASAGIRFEETHSHPLWGDFDNDGYQDLYITSVYPDRRSFLYLNNGDGSFRDVTWLSGSRVMNGWGAAAADFNRDGRLDLAVGTGDGPVLLSNYSAAGNWVLVSLSPPQWCNTSSLGCTVFVRQGGQELMRQVDGGGGTTGQNGPVVHFGLPGPEPFLIGVSYSGSLEAEEWTAGTPGSLIELSSDAGDPAGSSFP